MLEKLEKFQTLLLALVITAGIIIAAQIITHAISKDVITVTGSYSQNVTSDNGRLEFAITTRKATKLEAYNTLNKQRPIVIDYLKNKVSRVMKLKLRLLQVTTHIN